MSNDHERVLELLVEGSVIGQYFADLLHEVGLTKNVGADPDEYRFIFPDGNYICVSHEAVRRVREQPMRRELVEALMARLIDGKELCTSWSDTDDSIWLSGRTGMLEGFDQGFVGEPWYPAPNPDVGHYLAGERFVTHFAATHYRVRRK